MLEHLTGCSVSLGVGLEERLTALVLSFRSPEPLPKLEGGSVYIHCIYNPRHDSEWESFRLKEHLSTGCGLFHINMYINAPESCNFIFLFCFLIRSGLTLKNDCYGDFLLSCGQSGAGCSEQRVSESRAAPVEEASQRTREVSSRAPLQDTRLVINHILQSFFLRNCV